MPERPPTQKFVPRYRSISVTRNNPGKLSYLASHGQFLDVAELSRSLAEASREPTALRVERG